MFTVDGAANQGCTPAIIMTLGQWYPNLLGGCSSPPLHSIRWGLSAAMPNKNSVPSKSKPWASRIQLEKSGWLWKKQ